MNWEFVVSLALILTFLAWFFSGDDSEPEGVTLSTSEHAMVARAVTKAQALLGKMLEECDIEDHKEPLVQEAKDVVEFLEFAEKALDTEDAASN